MPRRSDNELLRLADPPPGWVNFADLERAMVRSEPARRLARIERLSTTFWVFERNSTALGSALAHADSPQGFIDLVQLEARPQLQAFLLEVVRLFYNYVSSAKSLVDHTRRFYEKHYEPAGAIPDYQAQVDARFKKAPVVGFVHDLRNSLEHRELPELISSVNWFGELRHVIVLSQAELRSFKKWSSPAKAFLRGSQEHIDLQEVRRAYDERVVDFHKWFRGRLLEHHASDLAEIRRMRAEMEPAARLIRTAVFQDNMRKGPESLGAAFNLVIGEPTLNQMATEHPDRRDLVEALVRAAREVFDVSEEEHRMLLTRFGAP